LYTNLFILAKMHQHWFLIKEKGVSLTGSAGASIAMEAGKHLKR
jgi:hypothetical protein